MRGEHLMDSISRRLATPVQRRPVVATLAAGVATMVGAAQAEPRGNRGRSCRRDRQCRLGEACDRGRCREADGTAGQFQRCRRSADCDTSEQPLVCELSWGCGGGECMEPDDCSASRRCVGGYDAATATGAQCVESCECAEDLECFDHRCRPRTGH